MQGGDFPLQPVRWQGPPAAAPVFFDPKIRTNLGLHSFGWPLDNIAAHFLRADDRWFRTQKLRGAVSASAKFNGGSDLRAVPAVFVPTSLANNYSGRTQL